MARWFALLVLNCPEGSEAPPADRGFGHRCFGSGIQRSRPEERLRTTPRWCADRRISWLPMHLHSMRAPCGIPGGMSEWSPFSACKANQEAR